jgi:hypothetical protein
MDIVHIMLRIDVNHLGNAVVPHSTLIWPLCYFFVNIKALAPPFASMMFLSSGLNT